MSNYLSRILFVFALMLVSDAAVAQTFTGVWYAKGGANGDGATAENPLGSAVEIERVTQPGDVILLLPSEVPLRDGLALKPGQSLIGLGRGADRPIITNGDIQRHGGVGILLTDNVRVSNVRIKETQTSGVYGQDVSAQLDSVEVVDANRSQKLLELARSLDPLFAPTHGGMVFVHTEGSSLVEVRSSVVRNAAGVGILSVSFGTADSRLSVRNSRLNGGEPMNFYDTGVAALVTDPAASTRLDLWEVEIGGRMSKNGRNVMMEAAGGAEGRARIEHSRLGPTGQDGILLTSLQSPASVEMYIGDTIVEGAGQINIEGTILNYPPEFALPANSGRVSIEVERSVVRSAAVHKGSLSGGVNVWLGPSGGMDELPQASGTYELNVVNSHIEGAERVALKLGLEPEKAAPGPDTGVYAVTLSGTTVVDNGEADIAVYAANANVDARGTCWDRSEELGAARILAIAPATRDQVDDSSPSRCGRPD